MNTLSVIFTCQIKVRIDTSTTNSTCLVHRKLKACLIDIFRTLTFDAIKFAAKPW